MIVILCAALFIEVVILIQSNIEQRMQDIEDMIILKALKDGGYLEQV